MRKIDFVISRRDSEKTAKEFLREFGVSSSLLKKLKNSQNGILINGKSARSIDRIFEGDTLTINIENSGTAPERADIKINILYEDEDLLAAEKPADMPVHESRNHRGDTLSNAVAGICGGAFRAIYRLDRDTSGIVLIAKNELAAAKLAGKIEKDYYAVACGIIEGSSIIDLPIRREQESIIKRCVAPDGERAVTHYEALMHSSNYTLLKLKLETGRTHQIRVHLSHAGHPLAGDELYGGGTADIARQALHCRDIYFTHPVTGKKKHIFCDFPDDFKKLTEGMR